MPDYSERFDGVFVHESSYVDDGVEIGSGTKIWHFSHILGNTQIGENCSMGQNVVVGPNVSIGNNVKIQNNVSVYDGVTLEDGVFCGPSCVLSGSKFDLRRTDFVAIEFGKSCIIIIFICFVISCCCWDEANIRFLFFCLLKNIFFNYPFARIPTKSPAANCNDVSFFRHL